MSVLVRLTGRIMRSDEARPGWPRLGEAGLGRARRGGAWQGEQAGHVVSATCSVSFCFTEGLGC